MVKIELVGAIRYGYKSEKYERGVHYLVKADRAASLLRLTTDHGFYVFREVGQRHVPAAPQAARQARTIPVVDTSKSQAEQFEEALNSAVEADRPVVVQPHAAEAREPDITEEEALASLDDDPDEGIPTLTEVVVEEVNVEEVGKTV
jgi:hypothetical protein